MEGCKYPRAHPSVVISLVASMARFARHGHPTYSFSNRVSDLIKLRFCAGGLGVDNCGIRRDKRPTKLSLFEEEGCNCLERQSGKSRGMYRAKGVACVIICTLEETGDSREKE